MPSSTAPAAQDAVHGHTIIVGAGPAGLAVGACLKRAGIPALILEQSKHVGAAWHRHYDRLRLNTDKRHSRLPFVSFPRDYPRYPSRVQVIRYLETYAQAFQLKPRFGQQVIAARRANGSWEVETRDSRYRGANLVIAAGYTREPYLPDWPEQNSFRGTLLHSVQYRSAEPFKGLRVLVVGFGNSGGEIALDLCEHGAETSLAVRSPVNVIPRELFGIPILALAIAQSKLPPRLVDTLNAPVMRAVMGDLTRYGLRPSALGPMMEMRRYARVPLIDVGTIGMIKRGRITVLPGVESFTDDGVVFTDGGCRRFDAVVLATGYRPRVNAFLEDAPGALDEHGTPTTSGRQAPVPGLYFCGYRVSPTGILREIGREAQRISAAIVRAN